MQHRLSFSLDQQGVHSSFGDCSWQRFTPAQALNLYADNFQFMRSKAGGDLPRVLPGSGALLCIPLGAALNVRDVHQQLGRQFKQPFIVCNRHAVLDISSDGPLELVVVTFRPGRLRYLVPASFAELQDRLTPASELWGDTTVGVLQERLALSPASATRIALLEAFLQERLPGHCDLRLDVLQDCLYLAPGTRIGDLAREAGWSLRHFERLFSAAYGVSPKYFARVARLQQVARNMALGLSPNVSSAVMDAGFYDQPHFIHELQRLSGLRPAEFAQGVQERPHFYNPQAIPGYRRLLRNTLGEARLAALGTQLVAR